jgi:hypothetical protein
MPGSPLRPDSRRIPDERPGCHFRLDDGAEALPLAGEFTGQNDLLGRNSRDQHPHPAADGVRHLLERPDRQSTPPPPQVHSGPFGSRATGPNSPTMPFRPLTNRPLLKIPVLTPADTVTTTRSRNFSP